MTLYRDLDEKVLLYSQMTMVLNILEDYLRWQSYPYERIDGCVKGNDRQAAIDHLQDQHRLETFVQAWDQLLAGGRL